ncbi:MAG TPA: Clp protease N-terminal domain-containing protein [Phycisphaerae bacterium]|nr:Clp protease N-terminal domain-containing protein [Phycisphaerae bacterium]
MLERFDKFAEKVVRLANQIARQYEQEYVGTEHVLLAVAQSEGLGSFVLKDRGMRYDIIKARVDAVMQKAMEETWVFGRLPGTPHFKNVVARAIEEARGLGASHVGTEHLLLGLLRERGCLAHKVLDEMGLTADNVRDQIRQLSKS